MTFVETIRTHSVANSHTFRWHVANFVPSCFYPHSYIRARKSLIAKGATEYLHLGLKSSRLSGFRILRTDHVVRHRVGRFCQRFKWLRIRVIHPYRVGFERRAWELLVPCVSRRIICCARRQRQWWRDTARRKPSRPESCPAPALSSRNASKIRQNSGETLLSKKTTHIVRDIVTKRDVYVCVWVCPFYIHHSVYIV